MDWELLFNTQKELDARIVKEHELEEEDLFGNKLFSFQVELGECANEWRGFKFWSKDQEPRTIQPINNGYKLIYKNPLLEEYVDCLHFALSVGLELELEEFADELVYEIEEQPDNITFAFQEVFTHANDLFWSQYNGSNKFDKKIYFQAMISSLMDLGKMLGFNEEQIEDAYFSKNQKNHKRQQEKY